MTAYLLALHLLHLALPAAVLAGLMVVLAGAVPGWRGRRPLVAGRMGRWVWTLLLNLALAVAGLIGWGADGRMATYGAMVLASALVQFLMWRGWRA